MTIVTFFLATLSLVVLPGQVVVLIKNSEWQNSPEGETTLSIRGADMATKRHLDLVVDNAPRYSLLCAP